jgi:putative FmdB family regulatory protein
MPTYAYVCDNCGHTFDRVVKIADRHEATKVPCEKCQGTISLVIGVPPLLDPYRMGIQKTPESWRDLLKHIKKNHRGSNINAD